MLFYVDPEPELISFPAWLYGKLTGDEVLVYLAMRRAAYEADCVWRGHCWYTIEQLALIVGMSTDAVQKARLRLEDVGAIRYVMMVRAELYGRAVEVAAFFVGVDWEPGTEPSGAKGLPDEVLATGFGKEGKDVKRVRRIK